MTPQVHERTQRMKAMPLTAKKMGGWSKDMAPALQELKIGKFAGTVMPVILGFYGIRQNEK